MRVLATRSGAGFGGSVLMKRDHPGNIDFVSDEIIHIQGPIIFMPETEDYS